jgi:hypothetical protein
MAKDTAIMIISSAGAQRAVINLEKYEADLKALSEKGLKTLKKPDSGK